LLRLAHSLFKLTQGFRQDLIITFCLSPGILSCAGGGLCLCLFATITLAARGLGGGTLISGTGT
jgi:hypothetical protein